jgi:hypothetical protein
MDVEMGELRNLEALQMEGNQMEYPFHNLYNRHPLLLMYFHNEQVCVPYPNSISPLLNSIRVNGECVCAQAASSWVVLLTCTRVTRRRWWSWTSPVSSSPSCRP